MPLRFFRRLRAGPFRLNVSKRGLSASIGGRGAWFTVGRNGTRTTVGLPGSGVYWTEQHRFRQQTAAPAPANDEGSARPNGILRLALWVFAALMFAGFVMILAALAHH